MPVVVYALYYSLCIRERVHVCIRECAVLRQLSMNTCTGLCVAHVYVREVLSLCDVMSVRS